MFAELHKSKDSLASLILRFGLAAIFIVHGYVKVAVDLPLVPVISMAGQRIVGWLELVSGLCLLAGLCTRVSAVVIVVLQAGAIALVSGRFAMDAVRISPTGANYTLVGPEYNLVLIAMCLSLLVLGAGVLSLDHVVTRWRAGRRAAAAPAPVGPVAAPEGAAAAEPAGPVPVG